MCNEGGRQKHSDVVALLGLCRLCIAEAVPETPSGYAFILLNDMLSSDINRLIVNVGASRMGAGACRQSTTTHPERLAAVPITHPCRPEAVT